MNSSSARLWVALALGAAVGLTYAGVLGAEFVRYDDPEYVLENPAVNHGLTVEGLRWAFTAAHSSNWHPLTWLAHMLDVELFGLEPAGHHAASIAWHALASALCFLALDALSGRLLPSALVAALFALHPLRVESVAWVSERKDVLCGCAFFALLWAHAGWARRGGPARYTALLAALVAGLLAKPMLVTAPFVLLLLDFWPLRRLSRRAWVEKIPLFALAAGACAVALWSQRAGGALASLETLSLSERLANAPVAVVRTLGHFFVPTDLAYFYPHPALVAERASPWTLGVVGSAVLVAALSAGAVALARRRAEVFVGWFWFLGMLVPVIGIVQVGEQALADRYAYLPAVGLQIALVFPLADLARARAILRVPLLASALVVLVGLAFASARQARVWRDSESLYRRALAVTEGNYAAWVGLANLLRGRGEIPAARAAFEAALAMRADYGPALYGLGLVEQEHGDPARAIELYRRSIAVQPAFVPAHLNLGSLLAQRGEVGEAAAAFERVLGLDPRHAEAHFNLALLLVLHNRPAEAREHLQRAVEAKPGFSAAWEELGKLEQREGRVEEARRAFDRAGGLRKGE